MYESMTQTLAAVKVKTRMKTLFTSLYFSLTDVQKHRSVLTETQECPQQQKRSEETTDQTTKT
jgi:hypothetical protein